MTRVRLCTLVALLALSGACLLIEPATAAPEPGTGKPAESLYLQLRSVGLDKSRVYRIRDASLDRSALHITFENGTIAFTQDVLGRVTGAFFEGTGEVLLSPPNKAERASMALFTKMAILEEQFLTGYFRFNDDTYAELQPFLRPAENGPEFVSVWDHTAENLADLDALRLLVSFSRRLPQTGGQAGQEKQEEPGADRMVHARVQGRKLGNFDLFFDTAVSESIWAGQARTVQGITYYDQWTSFAPNRNQSQDDKQGRAVNISRYTIRATVKPPTELDADARVQLQVQRGGQRALLFELSRFLQVKAVEVNGQPVEFINNQALEGTQLARRGNDLVAVIFSAPLKDGQKLELRFVYGGAVLSEAGKGLLYVGARGTWYPNRGLAMCDFDLEFHYPPEWTLLATGKRAAPVVASAASDSENRTPGDQVARWVSERPIPLAGFNLGKYVRAAARAGDIAVESYATAGVERSFPKATNQVEPQLPGPAPFKPPPFILSAPLPSPARNAQSVADKSARAVEFFARRLGPFPYGALELTQMPGDVSQGWPGLVFLSSYAFLTPEEQHQLHMNRVESILGSQVLVHETAHQWWGDLVAWSGYRNQWLVEGLANYCAMMMLESEKPADFHDVMEKYRQDLVRKSKEGEQLKDAGPVTLGGRLSSSHFPDGYEAISYGRGTWLFHMLREMMRDGEARSTALQGRPKRGEDEPFVRSLRKLRERYEGKVVTTRDMLAVFEEDLPASLRFEGRKSLDWFFDGWVNGTALPHYSVQGVKYTPRGEALTVSGTLVQKDAPEDLVTPVPVYAVVSGRSPVLLGRVFADGRETPFHLPAPAGTRKIELDPYQTLLTSPR